MESAVLQRQIPIEHAAPWLVSSVSGCYIMMRARHLSAAEASSAPLLHFLLHQSDVILMLCSAPAIWYITQLRHRQTWKARKEIVRGTKAMAVHQLRQVFTALLIGTGLLARKATSGKTEDLAALAQRLNTIAREGVDTLAVLGEPYSSDLLDEHGAPISIHVRNNGAQA